MPQTVNIGIRNYTIVDSLPLLKLYIITMWLCIDNYAHKLVLMIMGVVTITTGSVVL